MVGNLTHFLDGELPAALETLERMVGINSFTENRAGVDELGRLTAETFAPLGFTAECVPSVNPRFGDHLVLTRRGSGPRSVALISHLDTVFPAAEEEANDFRWRREGDRIYGPGTNDIKGGTMMIWLVLRGLRQFAPEVFESVTWRVLLNSSEETLSPDFGDVCRRCFDAGTAAALVFEAEGPTGGGRNVVVARKGRATWRVTATGRGAHAGSKPGVGVNAIVELAGVIPRIAAIADPSRELTVNPGVIRGGSVMNRVPHEAVVEGEMRAFDPAALADGRAAIVALTGEGGVRALSDNHAGRVEGVITASSRPWPRNAETDRLAAIWIAESERLGMPLGTEQRGGLSDGNLIWDSVPTLDGLGPRGDHAHCSERSTDGQKVPEYVEAGSFVPKAVINIHAILALLRER